MPRSNGETANREPAHDLQEISEHITRHVDVRLSAPMSDSALGLHSAPRAGAGGPVRVRKPAAPSVAGLVPQLPRATHGPQTRLGTAAGGASRDTADWSRPCAVADGVAMQPGYPARPVDVPNWSSPYSTRT